MLRPALLLALASSMMSCGSRVDKPVLEVPNIPGTLEQKLALFDYTASNTDSATDPDSSANSWIYLNANEAIMLGTCGLNESVAEGNTFLRLFDPEGVEVSGNDDGSSPGCTLGSKLSYVAPADGYYMIRAGCASSEACAGTVAVSRSHGVYLFTAANTNNATENTYNVQLKIEGGSTIRVSTCAAGVPGASTTGDTYLRLFLQAHDVYTEVAAVDDSAGCGVASEITYVAPATSAYQVRVGCSNETICSGQVAIYIE